MKDESLVKDTFHVLKRQLNVYWETELPASFIENVRKAIKKTEAGWDTSVRNYYLSNGFSVLNTAVYSVFLYYLAHDIGSCGGVWNVHLADKIYYLNKIMNSVEWYWNIELPDHFIVEHPIGSVLGKAKFGDYFSIYQGVTVGERLSRDVVSWPVLGHHITMFANSSVIGTCNIGDWVIVSANAQIMNQNIPDCSIVYGVSPQLIIKTYEEEEIREYFVKSWKL